MHELSIAQSLIETVTEIAVQENSARVKSIHLRVGELSCLVEEALRFSFELVARETVAEGARLTVEKVPARVWCDRCRRESEVKSLQRFCCAFCQTPTGKLRGGREIEIVQMEVEDDGPTG